MNNEEEIGEKYKLVRTKSVDAVYETEHLALMGLRGTDATEEEREAIDELTKEADEDLNFIKQVQEELLDYLQDKGCDVYKYLG